MPALLNLILPLALAWPIADAAVARHSCLRGAFNGITETDAVGERTGRIDRQDWGCATEAAATGARTSDRLLGVPTPPPAGLCLREAYPNPASSSVILGFTLPESELVTLVVYARETGHGAPRVLEVKRLFDGTLLAGTHQAEWNLTDTFGARVPAGTYRVVLEAGDVSLCGDVEVR